MLSSASRSTSSLLWDTFTQPFSSKYRCSGVDAAQPFHFPRLYPCSMAFCTVSTHATTVEPPRRPASSATESAFGLRSPTSGKFLWAQTAGSITSTCAGRSTTVDLTPRTCQQVCLQEVFPKLPAAVAFAIEMHVTMSVKQEEPGTMNLMPLGHLFAAASHGWCAQTLDRLLPAELSTCT